METSKIIDVYGQAIKDHYQGKDTKLLTFSSIAGADELPVAHLFRSFEDMPELEQIALTLTRGHVLDLGCGAGSHSLYLEQKDHPVTALDISRGAIEVCQLRGLKRPVCRDLWNLKNEKYDTILALMNGAGICGTLSKLPDFLNHLKSLLQPKGQVLMDSSDLIYMFEDETGEADVPFGDRYYGEIEFDLEYQGKRSGSFPWLYIDYYNLEQHALEAGFLCELVKKGAHYDYLARLTLAS